MFSIHEKAEWVKDLLNHKRKFTKKGKEQNPLIGKLVKIDWDLAFRNQDLSGGIQSLDQLSEKNRRWVEANDLFIVTDVNHFGLSSTVTLDGRFDVSVFRAYDMDTQRYLNTFEEYNGNGIFPHRPTGNEGAV